jgi:thiol-disulfide isomerase/thioredoxin
MRSGTWSPAVDRRLQAGIVLVVAALAALAGFYVNRASLSSAATAGAAERLMSTSLPDLSGKPQPFSQWRGKVLVVNFWATWCAPCREEIPALMRVEKKYASNGVEIVGIALDNASNVIDYANGMRIGYALLLGGVETLGLAKDLGNRAGVLPFTVVLNRAGSVVHTHVGALTEASLGAMVAPLL